MYVRMCVKRDLRYTSKGTCDVRLVLEDKETYKLDKETYTFDATRGRTARAVRMYVCIYV
jgi:hypothetical protein